MSQDRMPEVLQRLSNYFSFSDTDKMSIQSMKRAFGHSVLVSSYTGDWGLGSSRVELRFSSDSLQPYNDVDLAVVRYSNTNNPVGPNPGIIEGIFIDSIELRDIRRLRDHLNGLLGEGNSEAESS